MPLLLSACATDELPRSRLGALPFPGPLTLYEPSDLPQVGAHRYTKWWERPFGEAEGARGIMYTCRAGFLDLAHIRESMDWTRYFWRHARTLLLDGGGSSAFVFEDTRFELSVTLPAWWSDLTPADRAAMIEEASGIIGQRAAIDEQTWHEIATWYGWRTFPLVSEQGSAFTYDDTTSHLVGALIGASVLVQDESDYDRLATAALRETLEGLGAVPRSEVDHAARSVEGSWWSDGVAVRRDLNTGIEAGFKVPWLVPGVEGCAGCEPVVLTVPSLRNVLGRDLSAVYELRVVPREQFMERLRPGAASPELGITSREFPTLIAAIRHDMAARWGPEVDQRPEPPAAAGLPLGGS